MYVTKLLDSLAVLPCRSNDIGTQRCWLGASAMNKQSILLYDVVRIECTERLSFVCRAWPRLDKVYSGYIQFDSTVLTADVERLDKVSDCINSCLPIPIHNIQKVTCSAVESVSVTVVVAAWREFMLCMKSSAEVLHCRIRNLLVGFVIAASHALSCSRTALGKLYCWDRIIFHSVVTKNDCSCGFITPSSKISVVEIISKERFEQLSQKATVLGGLNSELNLLRSIVLQSKECGLPDCTHKKVSICCTYLLYSSTCKSMYTNILGVIWVFYLYGYPYLWVGEIS